MDAADVPPADRVKASRALAARASGLSWRLVAATTGYATRESARVACERELARRKADEAARKVWG